MAILSYDDFKKEIVEEVKNIISDKSLAYTTEFITVKRVNTEKEVLQLVPVEKVFLETAPGFNLENLYEAYSDGIFTMKELRDCFEKSISEIPVIAEEELKSSKNIFPIIVNNYRNYQLLSECPHEKYAGDLSVIYRKVFGFGENTRSLIIRNDNLCHLEISEDDLLETSLKNLRDERFAPTLHRMFDLAIGDLTPIEVPETLEKDLYVICNESGVYGSSALLKVEFLENLSKAFGDDFYILPSSIHELIIVPKSIAPDPEYLKEMVYKINRKEVTAEEFLSDTVFVYDSKNRRVTTDELYRFMEGMPDEFEASGEYAAIKEKYSEDLEYFYAHQKGTILYLDNIALKHEKRGHGIGTEILKELMRYADSNELRILCTPEDESGNSTKLKKWYQRYGFKKNTNPAVSATMVREPHA